MFMKLHFPGSYVQLDVPWPNQKTKEVHFQEARDKTTGVVTVLASLCKMRR